MPIRIVQSKHNARLKELRRALSAPGNKAKGLVGIEGPNLVEEAVRAGLRVNCVFAEERTADWAEALELDAKTEILVMPAGTLSGTLVTETPQPVAALAEAPDWTWADVFRARGASQALLVVLAGIQDPGNLGTILRSAEAFGATGIVCLPGTVHAWNPKAVRASAGSLFRVPVMNAEEDTMLEQLRGGGVRILTTTLTGAQSADKVDLAGPVALVIGNEGKGVPADLAAKADGAITIPCPGPVESLNAAMAASVLLYEASRQRAARIDGPAEFRGGTR